MQAKIYIVILNWNSWRDTIECLESVFRLQYQNIHIVVCDNASTDNSIEHISAWAKGDEFVNLPENHPLFHLSSPPVMKPIEHKLIDRVEAEYKAVSAQTSKALTLIQTGDNLGFAGGNNVGIRFSLNQSCDYVWLLNNDTVVEPDSLDQMLEYSLNQKQPNTCGSMLLFYNQPDTIQALGGNHYNKWTGLASTSLGRGKIISEKLNHQDYEKQLSYIAGASWLIPRQFLHDVGLMEESYFLYCEEIDWCVRNQDRYKLCYAPKAKVYHKEGSSIGSPNDVNPSSLLSDFYIFRNKLRFTRRFFPEAIFSAYLTSIFQAINRARRGQWDKAILIMRVLLGQKDFVAKK